MTIAAMKQALEALEWADNCPSSLSRIRPAITSLRAAIEQAEKAKPVAWRFTEYPHIVQRNSVNDALAKVYSGSLYWENLYTHPAPVPAGWQLVPVEPTPDMVIAGNDAMASPNMAKHTVRGCYKAMLAAAPKPGEMK